MSKASGVLVYTVVNRGNGNADTLTQTATSRSSAAGRATWSPTADNQTIRVPVAKNRDGSSITGPLLLRFTNLKGNTTALMIPRGQPSPVSAGVARHDARRVSISATAEKPTGVKSGVVNDSEHRLGVCRLLDDAVSRQARPTRICVKNGFDPALLYELQYTVKDPLVLGIGLAATRDLGSFFRYEKQDARGHRESRRRTDYPRDCRRQLAVGNVSQVVAAARFQPGRSAGASCGMA